MFIRDQKKDYLLTFKIDLSEELGCDVGVELREPNTLEMLELKESLSSGEMALAAKLKSQLPALMIAHDFYESKDKPMDNAAVVEIIYAKPQAAIKVMTDFTNKAFSPFLSKSASK